MALMSALSSMGTEDQRTTLGRMEGVIGANTIPRSVLFLPMLCGGRGRNGRRGKNRTPNDFVSNAIHSSQKLYTRAKPRSMLSADVGGGDDDPDVDYGESCKNKELDCPKKGSHKAAPPPAIKQEAPSLENCVQRSSRIWKRVQRRIKRDTKRRRNEKSDIADLKLLREIQLREKLERPIYHYRKDLNMRVQAFNPYAPPE